MEVSVCRSPVPALGFSQDPGEKKAPWWDWHGSQRGDQGGSSQWTGAQGAAVSCQPHTPSMAHGNEALPRGSSHSPWPYLSLSPCWFTDCPPPSWVSSLGRCGWLHLKRSICQEIK